MPWCIECPEPLPHRGTNDLFGANILSPTSPTREVVKYTLSGLGSIEPWLKDVGMLSRGASGLLRKIRIRECAWTCGRRRSAGGFLRPVVRRAYPAGHCHVSRRIQGGWPESSLKRDFTGILTPGWPRRTHKVAVRTVASPAKDCVPNDVDRFE